MSDSSFFIVFFAIIGGALRVSTPFMFVALGECLTEKSGRVNLGLEGTLVLGAMCAYAVSFHSGSPWLGVLAAGCAGAWLGAMHGYICKLPRVNDIAIGIAMMLFGTGLRHVSSLSTVRVKIGGEEAEVFYAGPQGDFIGLDQVNVRVPRSLSGRGEVELVLMVDGQVANTVSPSMTRLRRSYCGLACPPVTRTSRPVSVTRTSM